MIDSDQSGFELNYKVKTTIKTYNNNDDNNLLLTTVEIRF